MIHSKEIKVLFIVPFFPNSKNLRLGIFFKDQALALQKSGVKTTILYLEPRSIKQFSLKAIIENHFNTSLNVEDNLLVYRCKGWNTWINTTIGAKIWTYLVFRLAKKYFEEYGVPDIIHAHNTLWAGCAAMKIAKKYKIPLVITEHSSNFLLKKIKINQIPCIEKTFQYSDKIIAVSHSLAEEMLKYVGDKKVCVIGNVVDTEFFNVPKNEPKQKPFVFLSVANLIKNKGIDVLINAFVLAFQNNDQVVLDIAGDGPERENLKKLVSQKGLSQKVRFLGELDRENVRSAMWKSHVLVQSSYKETFGIVLIEAISTGIPVIATLSGGPDSIVTPDVGYLVQPGNPDEMAFAMRKIWKEYSSTREIFHKIAVQNYGEDIFSRTIRLVYEEVLSNFREK